MKSADIDLSGFFPAHRARLRALMNERAWANLFRSPRLIEEVQANALKPPPVRIPSITVVDQLVRFNEQKVRKRIRSGVRDRAVLLDDLSEWPEEWDEGPEVSFVGMTLLSGCNFDCRYCNKERTPTRTDLDRWKAVIVEAIGKGGERGPYMHFTGGEPLLLGEELYGDGGLIPFATERGAAVNVNTNGVLITPEVALKLIRAGTSRLHISLDTPHRDAQNALIPGDHFDEILRGIYTVQIAREVVGVDYPQIHINAVLTHRNLFHLTDALRYLLEQRRVKRTQKDGLSFPDMGYRDLLLHVVPVGGKENVDLRPKAEEFRAFYTDVWEEANRFWIAYQREWAIPESQWVELKNYGFYTPYFRVDHRGTLDEYVQWAAQGIYSRTALLDRCYVAPTQAFFLPDGSQYWCGAHTMSRPPAIGNINESGMCANIRRHLYEMDLYPNTYCWNCPGATLYINHGVDKKLRELIDTWIEEQDAGEQGSRGAEV